MSSSEWVYEEAQVAKARGILIPELLSGCWISNDAHSLRLLGWA